ncbi:unnamed protein product [Blepharisma stoltei]|uniref:Uncharacterized protein n=1 Tax=Blepharisma stoltei TaxID=1481888 RepID=A0AAU9IHM8_9CILI|nr:unnamed protein product [Blepharisma stoltei]
MTEDLLVFVVLRTPTASFFITALIGIKLFAWSMSDFTSSLYHSWDKEKIPLLRSDLAKTHPDFLKLWNLLAWGWVYSPDTPDNCSICNILKSSQRWKNFKSNPRPPFSHQLVLKLKSSIPKPPAGFLQPKTS